MTTTKVPHVDLTFKGVEKDALWPVDMNRVAAIILGGGQGTRLAPLTDTRCKPAISFGGKYRLIDIPMSNSINSGCLKIFIVTQFLSSSLHQHIFKTYRPSSFSSGFIELLPAEQSPYNKSWYQGPADAVRKNLEYFIDTPVDYFLILSGDQLYNFNFQHMVRHAKTTGADLVIAALPVNEEDAKRMGVLKLDEEGFVTSFFEKPEEEKDLKRMRLPEGALAKMGFTGDPTRPYLGSMGIYLFKRKALLELLKEDDREDFGKHLIPTKVLQGGVSAYAYDGYWEDIGTIQSFFSANVALTKSNSAFNYYDEENPIFSNHNNLPAAKIINAKIKDSIISEGSLIDAVEISDSILGPRSVVKKGTRIHQSYVMGNDFYEPPIKGERIPDHLQISENCVIDHAIVDKHVYIGKGVQLINKNKLNYHDDHINHVYIRDGIIIVGRGATLPDGFIL